MNLDLFPAGSAETQRKDGSKAPDAACGEVSSASPRKLPMLSTTAASKYRRCPRLYYYEQVERYRPAFEDPNRRFGKLKHRGLESWFCAARDGLSVDEWLNAALVAIDAYAEADEYERMKARVLMIGYHVMWSKADLRVLHVEVEFSGPLVNPETGFASSTRGQHGRLDVVVEKDRRAHIMEHKTTSSDIADPDYWTDVRLSSQVGDYLLGSRHMGIEPAGVIYDVIHKPGMEPLKATPQEKRRYRKSDGALDARQRDRDETPEEYGTRIAQHIAEHPHLYYGRRVEVRLMAEMEAAAQDLWDTHQQISASEREERWPRNTGACRMFGRLCAFAPVCMGTATLGDGTKYAKRDD